MSNQLQSVSRYSRFRKLWKPAAATGAGGTTLAIWFEEIMIFVVDLIGVILLAILGGLICLFDNFVFKSRTPRCDDLQDTTDKGVKN